MGEGESDTPRRDQFSSREEEREFRAADFDPTVKRALDFMSEHNDELEGDPESPVDLLIDELLAEQKKPQPDMFRLADIRQRLDHEHAIVMAQNVTNENATQHMQDRAETAELDEREDAIREIAKLVVSIPGLKQDITDMADEAIGDTAEAYPEDMQEILGSAENEVAEAYESIASTLDIANPDQVDERLRDQIALQKVNNESVRMIYAFLMKAQNALIGYHTAMLRATDLWRKQHHQSS